MTVLHVIEATLAGVGRHVLDLAGTQAERGERVHVAYATDRMSESFATERRELDGVSWHELKTKRGLGPGDVRAVRSLRSLIRRIEPQIVHGHSTKGGLLARLAAVGTGAGVVYTPNAVFSMNPALGSGPRRLAAGLENVLGRLTDTVIAVSPEEHEHLVAIGIDRRRLAMVPNGIGAVERAGTGPVRRSLGLPLEAPLVGFVGRIDAQKSPLDLIDVFARVADLVPGAQFVVVGDGPMVDETRARADKLPQLDSRTHFVGSQPGVWAMSGFDVFLLPSRYEGFPYVLIEAAALGLPIVTTDGACTSALFDTPQRGRVCPVGDIDAMAGAVAEVLAAGEPGRPLPDSRFTIARMVDGVDEVYHTVRAA